MYNIGAAHSMTSVHPQAQDPSEMNNPCVCAFFGFNPIQGRLSNLPLFLVALLLLPRAENIWREIPHDVLSQGHVCMTRLSWLQPTRDNISTRM